MTYTQPLTAADCNTSTAQKLLVNSILTKMVVHMLGSEKTREYYMEDIWTCHNEESTGAKMETNDCRFSFRVLALRVLEHLNTTEPVSAALVTCVFIRMTCEDVCWGRAMFSQR